MAINNQMNQFEMSALKASIARGTNPFTIPVIVDPDETATLIPGDFVKISTESSKVITVLKCAATDPAIGVILASPKKQSFVAEDAVEIGLFSTILWLEASGAVTAGDDLEYVVSGAKVKTNAGVNPICAVALTGASSGALIIAQIKTSITFSPTVVGGTINNTPIGSATPNTIKGTTIESTLGVVGPDTAYGVFTKRARLTLAQVNAGHSLVAAVTGKKLRLIDAKIIAIGANLAATANATGVAISATQAASSVALFTANLAQLTRSAVNRIGTASTAVLADGASFVANDAATAITVAAVAGTDLITSTYIDVEVTYAIEA
jgi:hypothetical protein